MKNQPKSFPYDNILHLPRHVSPKRAPMSNYDRAAQFSPFAALTGYDSVIEETGRLTDTEAILDEGGIALLNDQLQQILTNIARKPRISVTFFREDGRKSGGAYMTATGNVEKIDTYEGNLLLTDGTCIPIDRIHDIMLDL